MDKKTTGLIATIATAVLCGCPGLLGLCLGGMFAIVGTIPGSDIDMGGSSDPMAAIGTGIAILCVSVIFIAIPVVVGVVTLRKKPAEVVTVTPVAETPVTETTVVETPVVEVKPEPPVDDEPLPPAS